MEEKREETVCPRDEEETDFSTRESTKVDFLGEIAVTKNLMA